MMDILIWLFLLSRKLIQRLTTRVDFPSFTACDWLHASQSVNTDWFLQTKANSQTMEVALHFSRH